MNQDYEILQFKPSDFQDQNGNYWCDMALKGVSEPVKIVVKDPTQFKDGQSLYGHITDETSKAGKAYRRFRREKKADFHEKVGKKEWTPRDDMAIRAQWAIGQSMSHFATKDEVKLADVETLAGALFDMVDRVKDSGLKATGVEGEQNQMDEFKDKVVEFDDEAPINLADIPF
jgi:hypothetical protein